MQNFSLAYCSLFVFW